ncbi:DUF58 domain-containing protein [Methanococcus maripaludis]|uniref:Uncharacterized protein (DUF58 family) n=2 Tax=Methanococcus maripaludis TaxID=39152 RepID=A0A7J9PGF7_METMI|nr:DUF58 domain-containing protein [Methanococcus maripaludis]MBA2862312.1 uncharacterized protein (DUF58 family) [Methanococcus maripaludis]
MEKQDFLAYVSILLFLEGYLFVNILPTLFGVAILSYLLILKLSFNPDFEIEMQTSSLEFVENETFEIILKIKNNSRYPLTFKIKPNNDNFSWKFNSNIISPNDTGKISIFLKANSKGSFLIENISLIVSDVFEIFEKTFDVGNSLNINVYPSNESIVKGIRTNRNTKLGKEALSASKTGQRTSEFDHLRDYNIGDQFKHIDWKSSLKSGRLISKEFLKEIEGEINVLVDVSSNFLKDFSGGALKTDYVSILTFQIIFYIIKNHNSVNILFFDDSGLVDIKNNIKTKESLKKCIKDKLIPKKGTPPTSNLNGRFFEKSAFFELLKPFLKNSPEKCLSLVNLINSKSTAIIITDISRYKELIILNNKLNKKNSKLYVVSPNPFLFGLDKITEEEIPKIYQKYVQREKNILKLNKICPTVDVSPNDLADQIIGEFK